MAVVACAQGNLSILKEFYSEIQTLLDLNN